MNTNDFALWLHGFFEISESNALTEKQVQIIKDHLDLCFNKVTPDRSKEEWVQPYFGNENPRKKSGVLRPPPLKLVSPIEMMFGIGGSEQIRSGNITGVESFRLSGYNEGPKNSNDYYVTVSKNPNFDFARYSAFGNYNDITAPIKSGLENAGLNGDFRLVIDDLLNPTGQYAKGLVGDKDMIRGLPIEGPGIVNIGFGTPSVC